MCGIAGFFDSNWGKQSPADILSRMTTSVLHRGPDDYGHWFDPAAGIALGHRRLSIIDLSPEGHQPMLSACGRYVIVFNGETYNFQEIREELAESACDAPIQWRGRSDTEVMLAAFSRWGIEESLKRFTGMFAFALWDKKEQILYLARDRAGEKPLYYGWCEGVFLFGSELKALRAHPAFPAQINRDAISLFLRHNYIPAPYSIYQGIYKLLPGAFLKMPLSSLRAKSALLPTPYWSAREVAEKGISNPFTGSENQAAEMLNHLLLDTVKKQMVADVPGGFFVGGS